ncbi:MAG: UPF0758 domain-containing protein [Methanoregula sp.]|jgi:DNA repair protein RadC
MKKMKDVPMLDRPREKIAKKGVASLTEQELIESILGRGTRGKDVREIAKEICGLLKDHQGTIQYDDLLSVMGIGPSKAAQITACFELGRRYSTPDESSIKVTKPQDILTLAIVADMRDKRQEHFICISMAQERYLPVGSSLWGCIRHLRA